MKIFDDQLKVIIKQNNNSFDFDSYSELDKLLLIKAYMGDHSPLDSWTELVGKTINQFGKSEIGENLDCYFKNLLSEQEVSRIIFKYILKALFDYYQPYIQEEINKLKGKDL